MNNGNGCKVWSMFACICYFSHQNLWFPLRYYHWKFALFWENAASVDSTMQQNTTQKSGKSQYPCMATRDATIEKQG